MGMFKDLRNMQDQLWKDSMAKFPGSAFPSGMDDWQQKTLENISNWAGQAVKQSLELQQEWLGQWSERASGKKVAYRIAPRRPGDAASCYADPSRAERELHWKTEFDLDQMCIDSWNWQRKNPNGY